MATWKTIDDSNVQHVWAWPDGTNETTVPPDYYAENGTPMCPEDAGEDGEYGDMDMVYVRTEIKE